MHTHAKWREQKHTLASTFKGQQYMIVHIATQHGKSTRSHALAHQTENQMHISTPQECTTISPILKFHRAANSFGQFIGTCPHEIASHKQLKHAAMIAEVVPRQISRIQRSLEMQPSLFAEYEVEIVLTTIYQRSRNAANIARYAPRRASRFMPRAKRLRDPFRATEIAAAS